MINNWILVLNPCFVRSAKGVRALRILKLTSSMKRIARGWKKTTVRLSTKRNVIMRMLRSVKLSTKMSAKWLTTTENSAKKFQSRIAHMSRYRQKIIKHLFNIFMMPGKEMQKSPWKKVWEGVLWQMQGAAQEGWREGDQEEMCLAQKEASRWSQLLEKIKHCFYCWKNIV